MRPRGLYVALALLIATAGAIWWSNRAAKDQASKPSADAPKLVSVAEADVRKIAVEHRSGETTTIERDATGAWRISTPAAYPVDTDAVAAFVATVANVGADKIVEDKASDLAQFGLAQPLARITITTKDGKTRVVTLGDEAPAVQATYAMVSGDARLFTVPSFVRDSLLKSAADLRDRRLLPFDVDRLSRIVVTAQKSETEFGKASKSEWQIVKPQMYRADSFAVDEVLRKLKEVRLDPALTQDDLKKNAAAFNTAAVVAKITVADFSGPRTLELRKTKDGKYSARSTAVDGVYAVDEAVAQVFNKTTDDFRNKKLFEFGFTDPSQIAITGPRAVTVSRAGEKWFRAGKPLDSTSIHTLLDKLRDMTATKFAPSGANAPSITIAVTSADGKRTEKIALTRGAGAEWLARRDGDASIYVVADASVVDLDAGLAALKDDTTKPAKK